MKAHIVAEFQDEAGNVAYGYQNENSARHEVDLFLNYKMYLSQFAKCICFNLPNKISNLDIRKKNSARHNAALFCCFLDALVALHFTPVSHSLTGSEFWTSIALRLARLLSMYSVEKIRPKLKLVESAWQEEVKG